MAERFAALVLRQVEVGEADRILTLLTADRGRLDVRAGGVRRSSKRFGGLDLFVQVDVALVPGRAPPRLAEAEVRRDHAGLRTDVLALGLASYAAELLRQAAPEEQEATDLYRLGLAAFESLAQGAACPGWARAFEGKLLHVLGARPALRRCAVSGTPAAEPMRWSPGAGGILCGQAAAEDPAARSIDAVTVSLLDQCLRTPLADQPGIGWTPPAALRAGQAMRAFLDHHVAPPGKAWHFLQGLACLALVLVSGCTTAPVDAVRVQGFLYSTPSPGEDPALRVDGATGVAWSDEGEELVDSAVPFPDFPSFHRFADLALDRSLHLVFEPPDASFVPTVISGRSARQDLWVDEGVFHLQPRDTVDGWLEDWGPHSALPALDPDSAGGGIVIGTVADAADHRGLRLVVSDSEGRAWDAAYTDEEGLPSDRDALSAHGGFFVCCAADGPIDVLLLESGTQVGESFVSRAVEDGVTSMPLVDLVL